MPRYSAFVALDSGPGEYHEIEDLIEAPDPRAAAQQVIRSVAAQAGPRPLIVIIEEVAASIFTVDHHGQAITTDEDLRRAADEERNRPQLHVIRGHEPEAPCSI